MAPELAEAIRRHQIGSPDADQATDGVQKPLRYDIDGQILGFDPRLEAMIPEAGGIATKAADIEPPDAAEYTI